MDDHVDFDASGFRSQQNDASGVRKFDETGRQPRGLAS
jgi:hypothetical protein